MPLSSLPLLREGGWPAVLAPTPLANRVLQNVSLGDVFALTPRPAVLDGQGNDDITLADLDYSRSSLGDVVAVAFALGSGVTLADLSGAFTNGVLDPELQSWCTITNTPCSQTSVLSLGLKGAPLGETPLGETPLGETLLWDTPLGETPLGETPLGETPLGETPLGETPLGETALAGTPLGETPLGETDLSRAPLGETPLGETPLGETDLNRRSARGDALGETPLGETPLGETPLGETLISDIQTQSCTTIFVSCPPGTDTIDQHFGELQPNVTIADLVAVLTPAARASLTLGDLVASLADPNEFNVAQLLAVLDPPPTTPRAGRGDLHRGQRRHARRPRREPPEPERVHAQRPPHRGAESGRAVGANRPLAAGARRRGDRWRHRRSHLEPHGQRARPS